MCSSSEVKRTLQTVHSGRLRKGLGETVVMAWDLCLWLSLHLEDKILCLLDLTHKGTGYTAEIVTTGWDKGDSWGWQKDEEIDHFCWSYPASKHRPLGKQAWAEHLMLAGSSRTNKEKPTLACKRGTVSCNPQSLSSSASSNLWLHLHCPGTSCMDEFVLYGWVWEAIRSSDGLEQHVLLRTCPHELSSQSC